MIKFVLDTNLRLRMPPSDELNFDRTVFSGGIDV